MTAEREPQPRVLAGGPHDIGGAPGENPIDRAEHPQEDWEKLADAVHHLLVAKGHRRHDQLRRAIEALSREDYDRLTYFERRVHASQVLLVESGVLTDAEVADRLQAEVATWR
ncbi:MAG TPA: hypothetical protein VFL94_15330 [Actinomycetales bacterium]|nr:hypothetical protein [Actinomycetales bacterium]